MPERADRKHVMSLAGETGADPRTVSRWLAGESVNQITDYALSQAAKKLGIPPPEPPPTDAREGSAAEGVA